MKHTRIYANNAPLRIALALFALVFALSSCSVWITEGLNGQDEEQPFTGTLRISVPRVSPVIAELSKEAEPWSAADNTLTTKAYLVADTVQFELYISDGTAWQLHDTWESSQAVNINEPGDSQIVEAERELNPGSYRVDAYVYNVLVSDTEPVVAGVAYFEISSNENTFVNILCTPVNPAVMAEGSWYGPYSLPHTWSFDDLSDAVIPGSEIWFEVAPTTGYTRFLAEPETESMAAPYILVYNADGVLIDDYGSFEGGPVELNMWTEPGATYYVAVVDFSPDPAAYREFTLYYEPTPEPVTHTYQIPYFNEWIEGSLAENEVAWYYFDAVEGQQYTIWWDDSYEGSDVYTLDLVVSIYREDKTTPYLTDLDSGYSSGHSVTADATEQIWIRVEDWYGGENAGSYAIRVDGEGEAQAPLAWYPDGLWHLSSYRTYGSEEAWYYGSEDTRNFDTPEASNNGGLTSDPFVVESGTALTFSYWLDTEYAVGDPHTDFDLAHVRISTDQGGTWTVIADLVDTAVDSADDTWESVSCDLSSFAGQEIILQFFFDTVDSAGNYEEGWYVDGIMLGDLPV